MQALYHSPFLQALGYAIANSLWQVALLWLVVVLLNGLVNFSAATKYRIALTAQLGAFVWFLITFRVYFHQCTVAVQALNSLNITSENAWIVTPEATSFRSAVLAWTIKIEQLLPFLSIAYLFLLVFLSTKWIGSYRKAQQIRTSGLQKIDVEWRLFVQKVATQLDIKPRVQIFLSSVVNSPLTIGYLKPMILIPVASITHLTPQQLEALILHELAHIKRADYLINLLQSVIEITLFFNPFTQLLSRYIRNERENSCDDWVLQFQYNPTMYAEALLRVAHLQGAPAFAMKAHGAKGELLPRVKRMLNQQEKRFRYKQHLVALLIMTGVLSTAAWLQTGSRNSNSLLAQSYQNNGQHTVPVVLEPITTRVDNPLFNPVFFLTRPLHEEVIKAQEKSREQEKIKAVAAVRYQEPEMPPPPPRPAVKNDTVIIESMQSLPDVVVTTVSPIQIQVPQVLLQMQRFQEMAPPAMGSAEAFNPHMHFFNRQPRNIARIKMPPPPPPPNNIRNRPRPSREDEPVTAISTLMMQQIDSVRSSVYRKNINRMIASMIKEVSDSGKQRQSLQVRILRQLPATDLIDEKAIEETFRIFDRKDTWAYFRPVMKERDRNRTDATVATTSRPTPPPPPAPASDDLSRQQAAAQAAANRIQHQQQATIILESKTQLSYQQYAQPEQQVVTYHYKDVTITISSAVGNSTNIAAGSQQFITIRKVNKEARAENESNISLLSTDLLTDNEDNIQHNN